MKVGVFVAKKKSKKSFIKPALGIVAALAVIGAVFPSEEETEIENVTPPAIVEKTEDTSVENLVEESKPIYEPITDPTDQDEKEQTVVEVDPEQAFKENLNQYNYVGSSESDKYHNPKCRWVESINETNFIHFETEDEASAAGYIPCGTCKP